MARERWHTLPELVALARLQRQAGKHRLGPRFAAGDRLVCVTVTRERTIIEMTSF